MKRLTRYDDVRGCYVIVSDTDQNHIQRLGELEDRDEAKKPVLDVDVWKCPTCGREVEYQKLINENAWLGGQFDFCPDCGQRLKWGD